MPEGITSKVRLFADDTIAYLTISSDQDARTLQSDLDKLTKWETSWLMAFHPEKCNVLLQRLPFPDSDQTNHFLLLLLNATCLKKDHPISIL